VATCTSSAYCLDNHPKLRFDTEKFNCKLLDGYEAVLYESRVDAFLLADGFGSVANKGFRGCM
jgi:hypothetical protein